jgi:hypothetical protein
VRQRWTRSQIGARLANLPPCLIGMEACVGALKGEILVLVDSFNPTSAEKQFPLRRPRGRHDRSVSAYALVLVLGLHRGIGLSQQLVS